MTNKKGEHKYSPQCFLFKSTDLLKSDCNHEWFAAAKVQINYQYTKQKVNNL